MTIYTKLLISGVEFKDVDNINVVKRLSETSTGGEFSTEFWNIGGRHKSDFTVGNEVLIYAGSPTANGSIFTGILMRGWSLQQKKRPKLSLHKTKIAQVPFCSGNFPRLRQKQFPHHFPSVVKLL